jgi:hypothetical protein
VPGKRTGKRFEIYPYLHCKLIFVYGKYRVSIKPPFFHGLLWGFFNLSLSSTHVLCVSGRVIYKNPRSVLGSMSPHLKSLPQPWLDVIKECRCGFYLFFKFNICSKGWTTQLNKITTTDLRKVGKNRYRKKGG